LGAADFVDDPARMGRNLDALLHRKRGREHLQGPYRGEARWISGAPMTRHSWPKQGTVISPNKTERECQNGCGTIKVTRHEYPPGFPDGKHWPEFWNGLDKFEGKGTPPCTGRAKAATYDARSYPL
jgi:hypothetical protein